MDVQSILSEFLQYYRNTKVSSISNVNNGAFAATLGGEEQPTQYRQNRNVRG